VRSANNRIVTTSYTDGNIGSGHYCHCGHELTWEEWQEVKERGRSICGHPKKVEGLR
jgi:hypothetical protein